MPVTRAADLTVKVFADGADLDSIRRLTADPLIKGWTTNPTLMRQAGIIDYEQFAREMLEVVDGLPDVVEVFWDDYSKKWRSRHSEIGAWGHNIYVKIPVYQHDGSTRS